MQNKQQILAQKLARLDTVKSQMRALQDEYMPLKYESTELEEEIEELEMQLLSKDQVEDDKRFDDIVDGWDKQAQDLHDGVKTIEENEAIEEAQLINEIKNPEDYADFDLKDLESSQ